MKCPYCGAELIYDDYYYSGRPANFYGTAANGIYYPSTQQKLGGIYKCRNSEGFDNFEEEQAYIKQEGIEFPSEDITCYSSVFNGFFHTDSKEELHEGYPC